MLRRVVASLVVLLAACSSGGVSGDAVDLPTLATAPATATTIPRGLCGLLAGVAADADVATETAAPAQLEASMQGVAAFSDDGPLVAPPEVLAEVRIVARLYGALVDGLVDTGWDWGAFTASDHAVAVADIRADPATGEALQRIAGWSGANC